MSKAQQKVKIHTETRNVTLLDEVIEENILLTKELQNTSEIFDWTFANIFSHAYYDKG